MSNPSPSRSSWFSSFTWGHLIAFVLLDAIMAVMFAIFSFAAVTHNIEIPETETIDAQSLARLLAAITPSAEEPLFDDDGMSTAPDAPQPTPTETPFPTSTATPVVRFTPEPLATNSPTQTRRPSATATPRPTNTPTRTPTAPPPPIPETGIAWPKTLNIVLLGSDKRPNSGGWRTDTIIIVAIEPDTKRVGVISLPRDLWIQLPGYANRINTLDGVGGPKLLKQVLQLQLGIPIHYYARADFNGFVKAVDTLGGITVDVECRLYEAKYEGRVLDIPAGPVKMDGQMALAFVRSRYTTSDFDRMRRQQAALLAFRKKLLSPEMLPRLPELVTTLANMMQTDIPPQTLLALARLGVEIDLQQVRGFLVDEKLVRSYRTSSGAQVLLGDSSRIQRGVENIWNGQPLTDAIKRPRPCSR